MITKRKIIYGVIYIGVAVAFPVLPLGGLKFIGGMVSGSIEGYVSGGLGYIKEQTKDTMLTQVTDIKGPLWKILNPFE